MQNEVRDTLKRGEPSVGTWISTGSPLMVEMLARTRFQWLTIDLEHTAIDLDRCLNCFYAIAASGKTPFVRVPGRHSDLIKRTLDFGALGIVVPDIQTAEQAEQVVKACRYAPDGIRGIGSSRGELFYGPTYYQEANDAICVVVMIEHALAVENIHEIMAVPGVDVCFIGPNDLASSLRVPLGFDNPHPKHREAVGKVLDAGKQHGIPTGIHCGSIQELAKRLDEGFAWLPLLSDIGLASQMVSGVFRHLDERLDVESARVALRHGISEPADVKTPKALY